MCGRVDVAALVVERARQQAGGGGFADAADAGQHVGVRDAAQRERIGDGAHHRFLADQVGEGPRAVFPRQHDIAGAGSVVAEKAGGRGFAHRLPYVVQIGNDATQ